MLLNKIGLSLTSKCNQNISVSRRLRCSCDCLDEFDFFNLKVFFNFVKQKLFNTLSVLKNFGVNWKISNQSLIRLETAINVSLYSFSLGCLFKRMYFIYLACGCLSRNGKSLEFKVSITCSNCVVF